jgi:hypothetical protein
MIGSQIQGPAVRRTRVRVRVSISTRVSGSSVVMRACAEELGENKSRGPAGGKDNGGQARYTPEPVSDQVGDIRIDFNKECMEEEETGIGDEAAGSGVDSFRLNHQGGDAGTCRRQDEDGDEDGCDEGLGRDRTQVSRELASADEGPPSSSTVFRAHISLWPLGRIEISIDEKARPGRNKVRPAALHYRKITH